jgi:hypothetical protein
MISAFGFVFTCRADWYTYTPVAGSWVPAPPPLTDKPSINVLSPESYTGITSHTIILFVVTMPSTWVYGDPPNYASALWGTIRNVTCTLDQNEVIFFNNTAYGRDGTPATNSPININYSFAVNQASVGPHSLTINVAADTFCMNYERINQGYHYAQNIYCNDSSCETFWFGVDALAITNLSIENKSYTTSYLPLTYEINGTSTWAGFSLDSQANQTIYGNSTLTGLTEGNHTLIVYVKDSFGNMGKSDEVFFNVMFPTPTPSPSAIQQPTAEPSQTPEYVQIGDFTPAIMLIGIVAIAVVVVAVAVTVQLRKRRCRRF